MHLHASAQASQPSMRFPHPLSASCTAMTTSATFLRRSLSNRANRVPPPGGGLAVAKNGRYGSTLAKTAESRDIVGRIDRARFEPRSCRLGRQDGSGDQPVPAGHRGRSRSAVFRPQAAEMAYGSRGRGMR